MKLTIALPVHNEEKILRWSVETLLASLGRFGLREEALIVIADNGSRDSTVSIARGLASENQSVRVVSLPRPGKGGAIRAAWQQHPADILCFMDADLSTDLNILPVLIGKIGNGIDMAYGSRYIRGAKVVRSWHRRLMSGIRRWLVWMMFGLNDDTACGCKAVAEHAWQKLSPRVSNEQFFFDSELLLLARDSGFQVQEVPVEWVETRFLGRKSKVKLISTALKDFCDLWRLRRRLQSEAPSPSHGGGRGGGDGLTGTRS